MLGSIIPMTTIVSFHTIGVMNLGAIKARPTNECCVGSPWRFRCEDFDRLLPDEQPETPECMVEAIGFSSMMTAVGRASLLLDIEEGMEASPTGLLLIERGLVLTATQLHVMVMVAECEWFLSLHRLKKALLWHAGVPLHIPRPVLKAPV